MSQGIDFDETMAGPFAVGPTDPEEGRIQGEADGTRLAMHASVSIADLDAFIDDPGHEGRLTGQIEFDHFPDAIEASRGVFNLFAPTPETGRKLMVYELAFDLDGSPRYLAGRKEVRDDRGIDVWSDTTTLLTTLHQGQGRSDPVIGAGVLRLGATDLLDLLSTVRVTGAATAAESGAAVARFGAFFLGQLWDVYGPEVLRRFGAASQP